MNSLALKTKTNGVTPPGSEYRVVERNIVKSIETRKPVVASHLGDHAADRKTAKLFTWNPRHGRWKVDCSHIVGQRGRAVNPESNLIQEPWRKCVPPFRSRILVARALAGVRDWSFVDGNSIYFSVIKCVAREERVLI